MIPQIPAYCPAALALGKNNLLPLPHQERDIREALRVAERILARPDRLTPSELQYLTSLLHDYRRILARLQRHLPTELICDILLLSFHGAPICDDDLSLEPHVSPFPSQCSTPWAYTWVCRAWRSIVISEPKFWLNVSINGAHATPSRTISLLNTILDRGQGQPLSISFAWPRQGHDRVWSPLANEILTRLSSPAIVTRWDTIYFHLAPYDGSIWPFVDGFSAPNLRRAILMAQDDRDLLRLPFTISSPSLREVTIVSTMERPLEPKIPWNQLTYFSSYNPWSSVKEWKRLCRMPNLITYHVEDDSLCLDNLVWNRGNPPRKLGDLKHLVLRNAQEADILRHLITPSLESITDCRFGAIPSLISLIIASACKLQELSFIRSGRYDDADFVHLIRLCPSLIQLRIGMAASPCDIEGNALKQLFLSLSLGQEQSKGACPMLNSLAIHVCADALIDWSSSTALDLLRSRTTALRQFRLSFGVNASEEFYRDPEIDALKSHGINIVIQREPIGTLGDDFELEWDL